MTTILGAQPPTSADRKVSMRSWSLKSNAIMVLEIARVHCNLTHHREGVPLHHPVGEAFRPQNSGPTRGPPPRRCQVVQHAGAAGGALRTTLHALALVVLASVLRRRPPKRWRV
jgi:hypothetical protein